MRGDADEQADVDVGALVAGAAEDDGAQAGRDGVAEGVQRHGRGGVVVFALRVEVFVHGGVASWRGAVRGAGRPAGGREDRDGLVERGLGVQGRVEGEVGPGKGGARVEGEVEAGEVLHAEFGKGLQQEVQRPFRRGLGEETAVGCAGELGARVRGRAAEDLEVEDLEGAFGIDTRLGKAESDLFLIESPFLRRGVAGGIQQELRLEAALVEDGQFGGRRGRAALDVGELDAVFAC